MEREEQNRVARLPRHHELDLDTMGLGEQSPEELKELRQSLSHLAKRPQTEGVEIWSMSDEYFEEKQADAALTELHEQLSDLVIVSRAKVNLNRVYSAVYHSERTKDLIFFGGKLSLCILFCCLTYF